MFPFYTHEVLFSVGITRPWVRGLSKNFGDHGWPTTKNVKITLAKILTIIGSENEWLKSSYLELIYYF